MATETAQTITVIGATGNQGSGVVAALLDPTKSSLTTERYKVCAVSSNPEGEKAKALLAAHPDAFQAGLLQIVQGDLRDVDSLKQAFKGSYGVFAACPFLPGNGVKAEDSEEAKQGRNIVDAAKVRARPHAARCCPVHTESLADPSRFRC